MNSLDNNVYHNTEGDDHLFTEVQRTSQAYPQLDPEAAGLLTKPHDTFIDGINDVVEAVHDEMQNEQVVIAPSMPTSDGQDIVVAGPEVLDAAVNPTMQRVPRVVPYGLFVLPPHKADDEVIVNSRMQLPFVDRIPNYPLPVIVGYGSLHTALTCALLRELTAGLKYERILVEDKRLAIFLEEDSKKFDPSIMQFMQLYVHIATVDDYAQVRWQRHPIVNGAWFTRTFIRPKQTERYSLLTEYHGKVVTFVHPKHGTVNYFISAAPEDKGFAIATIRAEDDVKGQSPAIQSATVC